LAPPVTINWLKYGEYDTSWSRSILITNVINIRGRKSNLIFGLEAIREVIAGLVKLL